MKRVFVAAIVATSLALLSLDAKAQSFGGIILDHDIMTHSDMANLSLSQSFGTSRSMAMGGAFTSLGADISSININPAGLGMYIHDEFSITPMLSLSNMPTEGQNTWQSDSKTTFGLANIGVTFNILEKSRGSLISLTGAFSYNRTSDYNSRTSFSSMNEYTSGSSGYLPSMIDVFGQQLASANIYPESDGHMPFDGNPYFWPAQLAYKGFMLDVNSAGDGWTTNTLGYNSSILSSLDVLQKGRAAEYSFALGGNIANVLYFGATFTLNEISQSTKYAYQEEYIYNTDDGFAYADSSASQPIDYQLEYAHLQQTTMVSGAGCGLKLGVVARPTRALRIGVAFHTPTIYTLSRSYEASIETSVLGNYDDLVAQESFYAYTNEFIDTYDNSWQFSTPPVLLTGISYQVGAMAILSFDYEREWYNAIRVQNTPYGIDYTTADYKNIFKSDYQPTNTYRLGVEFKPTPTIALRGGAGYTSSMLSDSAVIYGNPVATSSRYFSCGVGFRVSPQTSFDLAYQNYSQDYSSYKLFYSLDDAGYITESKTFTSSLKRHYIVATLTVRL